MRLFGAHGWGGQKGPFPKICHAYSTMMKLDAVIPYLKKIQKHIIHVTHLWSSGDISIFSPEVNNFCYIRYRLHFNTYFLILLTFFKCLKVHCLSALVAILMMSAKLVTLGLLKKGIFK